MTLLLLEYSVTECVRIRMKHPDPANIAALHTVSFVHGCLAGKCILTGSTEQRCFKVDGSMEKKWDTVIPADLKRLFCKWDIYVLLVMKGLKYMSF